MQLQVAQRSYAPRAAVARSVIATLSAGLFADLLVFAGGAQLRSNRNAGGDEVFAYDYSKHGQDWMGGSCSSRSRQSPIDLPADAPVGGTFAFNYNPIVEPFEIMNTGHAFAVDFTGQGYGGITYENAWYDLQFITLHSMSEHTWAGMQKPVELHLVHKRADGDALLVVAVGLDSPLPMMPVAPAVSLLDVNASHSGGLRKAGKQAPPLFPIPAGNMYYPPLATEPFFNEFAQAFMKMPPPPVNMKVRVPADSAHPFKIHELLTGATFYDYAGSLTAPPCTETVTWLVRKEPLKASHNQILFLQSQIYRTTSNFGNYRSLMPLNGRVIVVRKGMQEDLPPTAAPQVQIPQKPQQSDREYRAMKWAQDAMSMAKSAKDYVRDIDSRLRKAAQAHANALAPQLEPLVIGGKVIADAGGSAPKRTVADVAETPLMSATTITPSPKELEKQAETMARTLSAAAREEIEDATQQIAGEAKQAAQKAAREAADMVMTGDPAKMDEAIAAAELASPTEGEA